MKKGLDMASEDKAEPDTPASDRTRQRVTGDELQQRFTGWRNHRRSARRQRSADQRRSRRQRIVVVTLAVAFVSVAVGVGLSSSAHEQASASNAAQIKALEQALARDEDKDPSVTAASMLELTDDATAAATSVAQGQQAYAKLYVAMNAEVDASQGNGAPGPAVEAMIAHRKSLAGAWSPTALIVDDQEAYTFTTVDYFGDDEIDPRFAWFVRYDGLHASDPSSYAWSVASVMPQIKAPTTARVVWVCRDSSGTVLAWANAIYDHDTTLFDELQLVVTSEGAEHVETTESDHHDEGAEDVPEVEGQES